MAAEPATDALYKALSSPNPDPQVVHAAIEEVRQIASQNVIAVIGGQIESQSARIDTQITELKAKIGSQGSRLDAQITEVKAGFTEVNAKIDALGSRIDTLQKVIWPLIVLLASTVFGLLYKVVTG